MKLGEKIQYLRKEKNYSQEEFAKILKIGRSTLANYEQCKREPKYDMIELIAEKLETTPAYLMSWDEEVLNYVVEDDKELVKHFLKHMPYNSSEMMTDVEMSFKKILNSFGYDLTIENNCYYLINDNGASMITKKELNELILSTSQYIEFNVNKIILNKIKKSL